MRILTLGIIPLLASGCMLDVLMSAGIQGELQKKQLESAGKALDYAQNQSANMQLTQAIAAYRAEKGVNPPSLEALVPTYLASVPLQADGTPYNYDPATGQFSGGPGMTDDQKMAKIHDAVNRYGQATGWYPPSLNALVEAKYLDSVPKNHLGQDFLYDPRNGALVNPTPQPAATAPAGGRAVGGGGLMGETLTGIGIQQELNSMSSAGAVDAGSRMRGSARNIQTDQNDRQNRAMDNLGL